MTDEIKNQIKSVIKKQKEMVLMTDDYMEEVCIYGIWSGFLAGITLSKIISRQEYNVFFDELMNCIKLKETKIWMNLGEKNGKK